MEKLNVLEDVLVQVHQHIDGKGVRKGAEHFGIRDVLTRFPEIRVVISNTVLHVQRELLDPHELANDLVPAVKSGSGCVAVGDQNWNVTDYVRVEGNAQNLRQDGKVNLRIAVLTRTVVPISNGSDRGHRPVNGAQISIPVREFSYLGLRDHFLHQLILLPHPCLLSGGCFNLGLSRTHGPPPQCDGMHGLNTPVQQSLHLNDGTGHLQNVLQVVKNSRHLEGLAQRKKAQSERPTAIPAVYVSKVIKRDCRKNIRDHPPPSVVRHHVLELG